MMQEYGTIAKLLSNFEILNQVFDGFIMLYEIMNPFFFDFYIVLCCYLMVDKCSVFLIALGWDGRRVKIKIYLKSWKNDSVV